MDRWLEEAEKWMIITDLDGTIVDNEPANFEVLQQVLEEFGWINHHSKVLEIVAEGMEEEEAMKLLDITPETKKRAEERMKYLLKQKSIPLLSGVRKNISILKDMGMLFCIATDNYSQTVSRVIREHDLNDVFEPLFILTIDTFPERKPSSDIVEELMKRSGRKKAIIVGNTPKEIILARNSRCPAVIITPQGGMGKRAAKKKGAFGDEWEAFGSMHGEDVYFVANWEEVKDTIIEIIYEKSREE